MQKVSYHEARQNGELIHKESYHQPDKSRLGPFCGCKLTTKKGAYRDETYKMPNGLTVHFYHQSPIVIESETQIRLDNCGYQTMTTKERINRYCPFRVFQENFKWYVNYKGETIPFENGMVLDYLG